MVRVGEVVGGVVGVVVVGDVAGDVAGTVETTVVGGSESGGRVPDGAPAVTGVDVVDAGA